MFEFRLTNLHGVLVTTFAFLFLCPPCHAAEPLIIELDAGQYERIDTLVIFELPRRLIEHGHFTLTRLDDGAVIEVQRLPGRKNLRAAFLIRKPLKVGETRRYRLAAAPVGSETPAAVICHDDGEHLLIEVGGKPVLRYNHAVIESPAGIESHFRRSGHIHPLYDPSGRMITDDFPPDHAHQHGIFFAWVNTTFAGHNIDFWNQTKGTGRIEHDDFLVRFRNGKIFGGFVAKLRHSDMTNPSRPTAILEESWTVRVYNLQEYFLLDIESRQRCVAHEPLTINEYRYGGMAIRGSRQWFDEAASGLIKKMVGAGATAEELAKVPQRRDYLTNEGRTWIDGNATRARWVEMHGEIDGQHSGITIMCHPANFRAPQPVRLHPRKPYFCFAPMILGKFEIPPGETFVSRYRYYIHTGPPDPATSNRLFDDYAHPPEVRIVDAE